MKKVDNIEALTSTVNMATGKTVAKDATEQVDASNQDSGDLTFAFYAVGIVINLVMIAAYFIWAFKQWNKK